MSEEKTNFFEQNREPIVFTILSALVLLVYWQTTKFGFINLDDNLYVYENPYVLRGLDWETVKWSLTAFHSANWHPLTWLSLALDVEIFGPGAGGHHAANIVFHLINSLLAFAVFRLMTGCFWKSAVVAALFAAHPAHVESVAWIAERKDVLSTFFWLLTMWAYFRYVAAGGGNVRGESEPSGAAENREIEKKNASGRFRFAMYLSVVLFFALGLTAKPMLVTLPFVLLLCDFWPLERLKSLKDLTALTVEKIPLFALSAASSYVTILAQKAGGAVQSLEVLAFETRVVNSVVSAAKYVAMLFYPANLSLWYPYEKDFPAWEIAGSIALLIGVTALCLWQARRRKYLLMGWLWFLGTLVPVIGLVQVGAQSMADRYTYIPYFGLFVMGVWGLSDLFGKRRKALFVFFAVAIVIFSLLSFRQTSRWRNEETLYLHTLAVTEENYLIAHNLCFSLMTENRLDEAEKFCRDSIRAKPDYHLAYNTLGILQTRRGEFREAEASFREVLRVAPNYSLTYANLSVALALQDRPEEAEENLEKAVRLSGGQVQPQIWINALNDVVFAYAKQKNHEKAAENLRRILNLAPGNADARGNLALTLYNLKRYHEAQAEIEEALRQNPDQAAFYHTKGLIFLEQNRTAEAAALFEKALQLNPDYTEAKENLRKAREKK